MILFDEYAHIASRVNCRLCVRRVPMARGKERVPLAGIPLHALDNYVGKLYPSAGRNKAVICEQVGEVMKGRDVVERAVTRILTAGTLSNLTFCRTAE